MLQVALVGDSHLTDTSTRAVTKLGPRLRLLGLRVVTHARDGMNSRDALLLPPPAPDCDWIVYCLGTNDAAPWNQVPPEEFAANYDRLLRVPPGPRKLVLGPPPVLERAEAGGLTNDEVGRYSVVAGAAARDCGALFTPLLELLDTDDLAEDGVHLNDNGYGKLAELVVGIMGADHCGDGPAVECPDHRDSRP
jgi:lysophospholipase L1-like esterase